MALIRCPECGKEISDLAEKCPNCGYPIKFNSTPVPPSNTYNISSNNNPYKNNIPYQSQQVKPYKNSYTPKKERNNLSLAAFILSILGCTFIIGFVLAIIDIRKDNSEDKRLSWYAVGICCFWLVCSVLNGIINPPEDTGEKTDSTQETSIVSDTKPDFSPDIIENNETTEQESTVPEPYKIPDAPAEPITYEEVFFYTLVDNIDTYNGQYVRTSIEVYTCYDSEDRPYIKSRYADSNLSSSSSPITVYPDNYQYYERGDYITVEGRVAKENYDSVLIDAHIISSGEKAKIAFDSGLSVCQEEYNKRLQQEKDTFIESCINVSYDDLRRYPESYEDVPIKITIYAKDVEPDGWIFPGDIIATVGGEELAVYDDRIVREPRIMEGDTITVYATGYGLSTIKLKQKGIVFSKTVDEYNVPAIKIKYTEKDNDFSESTN